MYAGVQFMVQTTAELVGSPRAAPLPKLSATTTERMPHLEEWLLAVSLGATLWVVCAAAYFPYHDATNNLARYVLMDRAWFGTPASFVQVRLLPTPYIALDLIGVLLVHFLGPAAGLRAMACLLVTVVPAGMYALLRATCPERRGWALVGVLCSLTFYLFIGFFNFVAGIGVALFWLAAWWPRRDATRWRTRASLLVGLAGVFLVHLAGAMTVLVVVGIAYLVNIWSRVTSSRMVGRASTLSHPGSDAGAPPTGFDWWRTLASPRFTFLVSSGVTVGIMSIIWHLSLGREPSVLSVPPDFRSLGNKIENLASPFYSFSYTQMVVMGAGYAASLFAFLAVNRRTLHLDALLASTTAFAFLFFIFPYRLDGAGYVDMRWLLPALVLPFCATAITPAPTQRSWLAIPFVATLLHLGVVHHETRKLDAQLTAYRQVIDAVPPGARLLPIVANREQYGRLDPLRHFALWHTIDGGGRVPGLLSEEERYSTNPPPLAHKFFGHFREPDILYYPDEAWGAEKPYPQHSLDWRRIDADYDYIVVAGRDPAARTAVAPHADEVSQRPDIALYRVRSSETGAPTTQASAGDVTTTGTRTHTDGFVRTPAAVPGAVPTGRHATVSRARPRASYSALTGRWGDVRARFVDDPSGGSGWHGRDLHAGGFYTTQQLDYVIGRIQAHAEPWASAYQQLLGSVGRVRGRQPHAVAVYNVPGYYDDQKGFFAATGGITGDADAAYVLALAYRLGDGASDADAAQRILTAWAHADTGVTGHDGQLSMAEVGVGFVIAAELLSNYPGWSQSDREAFARWVRTVYLAQAVNPIKDRKNNWGDWGSLGAVTADDYLGDMGALAAETVLIQQHIDSSIAPDGHMPEETARGSGGIWYMYFALDPLTAAMKVVRNAGGPNLFDPSTPQGARVEKALTYLFNALQNPSAWPFGANPKAPQATETWGYDLFDAMANIYGNAQWAAYAASRHPIQNTGHHYAWTFPTLMNAPYVSP